MSKVLQRKAMEVAAEAMKGSPQPGRPTCEETARGGWRVWQGVLVQPEEVPRQGVRIRGEGVPRAG